MVILNTVNSDLDFLLNFRILKTDTCKSHKTTTKFVYLGLCKIFRSLLGNVIKTVRSKGSDILELPTLVEKKSKQTDLNDTPEPMSLPINDVS